MLCKELYTCRYIFERKKIYTCIDWLNSNMPHTCQNKVNVMLSNVMYIAHKFISSLLPFKFLIFFDWLDNYIWESWFMNICLASIIYENKSTEHISFYFICSKETTVWFTFTIDRLRIVDETKCYTYLSTNHACLDWMTHLHITCYCLQGVSHQYCS